MDRTISLTLVIKNIDGGTGTFLKQMLRIGKPIGRVSVLALEEPTFDILRKADIHYCRDKNHKEDPHGRISATRILVKELIFLGKELRQCHPDVIIAIDTHCNMLVCLVKLFYGIKSKLILTVHNNTSGVFAYKHHLFPVWLIRLAGNLLFRISSCMVGVSKGVVEDMIYNFHPLVPMYSIFYGLDVTQIRLPLQRKRSKDVPVVVTVSRLAGQKDIKTLIRATQLLLKRGIRHTLLILGDGNQKGEYEQMIRQNHLEDKIILLGWKKDIYSYLARSDIFVLSTHYEGFPFVLLEAMKAGLPIVATDVYPGPRELLRNNMYGLLTQENNYIDLADKLELLIKNKKVRKHYHHQSLLRIKDFSEHDMLEKYRQIITNAVSHI